MRSCLRRVAEHRPLCAAPDLLVGRVALFVAGFLGSTDLQAATYVRVNIGGAPTTAIHIGTMAITIIAAVGIGPAIIATVIGTIIRLDRRRPGCCQHARQHKVAVGRARR